MFNISVDFDIFFSRCVDINFVSCKLIEGSIKRHSVLFLQYSFVTLLHFDVGEELPIIRN